MAHFTKGYKVTAYIVTAFLRILRIRVIMSILEVPIHATVIKARFVVHTIGLAGWNKSRNHWSIYLILAGEISSVRLNMSLASGNDENGTFTTTLHQYALTTSSLRYFDYNVHPGLTVGQYISLIITKERHMYQMTDSGNGCRFWV
jgi:hypothetical protein